MVDTHRGIVTAWDERNRRPKGVTTPADMRLSLASLARAEGIMAETGAAEVTRPNTRMAIAWSAFTAVISSPRGGWLCPRVEAGEVPLAVGSTTYPRTDVVWVRHWDYEVDGTHPDSEVEVGVTQGTPSSSPRVPSVPSGALAVFTVTVPRGATVGADVPAASIVRARWTTPVGGILTAATQAEADALVRGVAASAVNPVYVRVSGVLRAWDGTRWEAVQAGDVRSSAPLTAESWWVLDPSSGHVHSVGALHLAPLTIRWPRSSFDTRGSEGFPIAHIPASVPAPPDWTSLGTLHAGAYAVPLVYRSADRSISVQPTSSFTWGTGWCYGTATWVA
ncbi:hypothetical protein [Actinomyces faecalis]|uniref:hypothetical protein n=1 Tax=Actinomyces faecalis TaxID=2722820 RepID=UPI001556E0AB|nr:hypothetical protein [Actinomyces faecalis]